MLNQAMIDQLEMIAHQHGEPYDFLERRCAALNAYHPERADSFATAMLNAGLTWPASAPAAPMAASLGLQLTGTGASQVRLPEALRTQGVLLMDLFEAARIHPRLLDRFLMTKACQPTGNRLALHRAFLNAGIFVYVPDKGLSANWQPPGFASGFFERRHFRLCPDWCSNCSTADLASQLCWTDALAFPHPGRGRAGEPHPNSSRFDLSPRAAVDCGNRGNRPGRQPN